MKIHKRKGERSRSWSTSQRGGRNNNAWSWTLRRESSMGFGETNHKGIVQYGDHFFYLHTAWKLNLPTHFFSFFDVMELIKEDDPEYDEIYWAFY